MARTKTNGEKTKTEVVPYENSEYTKSNFLIGSKYKSSLLEMKLTSISLTKMQRMEFQEEAESGDLVCSMRASELRKLLPNGNDGSFYQQLEPVAKMMTSRTVGWSDPERHEFDYVTVITRASYKDGIFTVKFNSDLKKYLKNLHQQYTILQLPTMLSFKSAYSFRLYEVLSAKCYYPKGKEREDNYFKVSFSLSELKLEMGVVNANLDSVQRVLRGTENPDYDKAVERSPEKQFNRWSDFKTRVLDVARKEINEISDMDVDYEPIKQGRGGRVVGVIFYVQKHKDAQQQKELILDPPGSNQTADDHYKDLSDDDKMEFYFEVRSLVGSKLPVKDIRSISEAADYNIQRVRDAVEVLNQNSTEIKNLSGWLITAIKEGYRPVKKAASRKRKQANTDYEQRNYDYSELEKILLRNEA